MVGTRSLCLNMIVKNETANLERCLSAVAPHIQCWVIGDTGSTDRTQDYIEQFFSRLGIPGEIHQFPFQNFEQARNEGLNRAYASALSFDYLLLDDADMELVVDEADFASRLEAPGYQLVQRSLGGLRYWNTRLVRRDIGAQYKGVTHEYLDVPGGSERLSGVWYRDHASGSNRVDKFDRDARLLKGALKKDPENSRYWFYLAQSYYDGGHLKQAASAYAKRAELGGWDEEAWVARLRLARTHLHLGNEADFVTTALATFNQRPQRAEPLYDLARHYRIRGENHASALFAEQGLRIPIPDGDILFVEDWVYQYGMREEFSIAANYAADGATKQRGFDVCNALSLDRAVPESTRTLANANLDFYVRPLSEVASSFTLIDVEFPTPPGSSAMNPSIARRGDELWMVQGSVNYHIDPSVAEDGEHPYRTANGDPIRTRNFVVRLDEKLNIISSGEILDPIDLPQPAWSKTRGFEDLRLFAWRGELWCTALVGELDPNGRYQTFLARVAFSKDGPVRLADWRVLDPPEGFRHEKNWVPVVDGEDLRFITCCDPIRVFDDAAQPICEIKPSIDGSNLRGGTQLIPFGSGWLALVHDVVIRDDRRKYRHRFIIFDTELATLRLSAPFYFNSYGIESASGLAWHVDNRRLIISFGVNDGRSWLATVDSSDIAALVGDDPPLDDKQGKQLASNGPTNLSGERSAMPSPVSVASNPPPETTRDTFLRLAPFLNEVDDVRTRAASSQSFDESIASLLSFADDTALPQVHCFYEIMGDGRRHDALIASVASICAQGHPLRMWSYSPEKLDFLLPLGAELRQAADVVPRELFDRVLAASEIRYFSDVFRYAVLYEQGGLWLDSDLVLLRPFPFRGEHFFNLQWRSGWAGEHFVCGDVIYAKPHSPHLRALYERSLEICFAPGERTFGDVGPKLLSDYIASRQGADLQKQLFSPIFFNSIDWTESEKFERPIDELADLLNDERVFGVHMWTARHAPENDGSATLLSMLSNPARNFPPLTQLADHHSTDKNRHFGNRHCYARIYEKLLSSRRLSLRRLLEIGSARTMTDFGSMDLWREFFPFAELTALNPTELTPSDGGRITSILCDLSNVAELRRAASLLDPASFDVIIDDGSHASHDEQLALRELFPLLQNGGWYFIEDLDWQPPGEDRSRIAPTKDLIRDLRGRGRSELPDPLGIAALFDEFAEVHFFDSHYELGRALLVGGMVAIRKRGGTGLVR